MKKSKKKKRMFNNFLEIPEEVITNEPKINIYGFNKMFIENYEAILEYQDFFIRIKTTIGIININGFNLKLNNMTQDDVMVLGTIDSVDFEKTEE